MPLYAITHRTVYAYSEPVSTCHNLAYLLPRPDSRHTWLSSGVTISPTPAMVYVRPDVFGNRALFFAVQEPHRQLVVTATGRVEVAAAASPDTLFAIPWERARHLLNHAAEHLQACQFLYPSPYVAWPDAIDELVRPSFPLGRPLVEAVLDLTARIHKEFSYDSKATTVSTTVAQLLSQRRGVCQDLAHVQIACLRAMGLAARYVSGYLRPTPPPGRPRLVGADASHAWVSVYGPDGGWLDVDPTNNVVPSEQHITIAYGRDYGDVCPLRGVILGGGTHTVQVSVDVALAGANA